MNSVVKTALILFTLAFGVSASAQDDQARFEQLIGGIDSLPNRAQLESEFKDPQAMMLRVAENDKNRLHVRAISMLPMFPSKTTKAALLRLAEKRQGRAKGYAFISLSRAFSTDKSILALAEKALSSDKDEHARALIVTGVSMLKLAEARTLIEKTMRDDKSSYVRATAKSSLSEFDRKKTNTTNALAK